MFYYFVDTLANTVHSTVDATKSVASSAVDKGVSFVGSAKGSYFWIVSASYT